SGSVFRKIAPHWSAPTTHPASPGSDGRARLGSIVQRVLGRRTCYQTSTFLVKALEFKLRKGAENFGCSRTSRGKPITSRREYTRLSRVVPQSTMCPCIALVRPYPFVPHYVSLLITHVRLRRPFLP